MKNSVPSFLRRLGGMSVLAILAGARLSPGAQADPVLDWNTALRQAAREVPLSPPVFSRTAAIVHAAVFDALNGIRRNHHPYQVTAVAPSGASAEAAIAAAAHTAAYTLITDPAVREDLLDPLYASALAGLPDDPSRADGLAWGQSVAEALLALRADDGSADVVPFEPAAVPGIWRPTLPAFAPAVLPQWAGVAPFCLPEGGASMRPHPPPGLTTSAYAFELTIVRDYGAKTGSLRTDDESEIALFWADDPGSETPPGHWNRIAAQIAVERALGVDENARLFALLNLALADAAICAWDCKYAYQLWRPITAIREADTDGNPATLPDAAWEPFVNTPAFPEYTSGHSTFSRAGATVLAAYFGTDAIPFSVGCDALPGVTRSYPGFGAAADESGISRIYGGIHWPSANIAGQVTGHLVGVHVVTHFLLPLDAPTFGLIKRQGQSVTLTLRGETGRVYLFQGSTDLTHWTDIATATAVDGEAEVVDATASPFRFYRAQAR